MIFTSEDGILLHSNSLQPAKPKASLLVVHGLGEHLGRYDQFSEEWIRRGFAVHRLDLRGHGSSGGPRGHVENFSQYHSDIEYWTKYLESSGALNKDLPCFLFGHSLGGLISLGFVSRRTNVLGVPIQGLILSSPALGVPPKLWTPLQRWVSKQIPSFLSRLQLPNGISADYLSHNQDIVAAYKEDPLVHSWITPGFGKSLFEEMATTDECAKSLRVPLQVLMAGDDKVVSNRATELFVAQVKKNHPHLPFSVKKYAGAYHEIFNENHRQKAFAAVQEWVETCLVSLGTNPPVRSTKPNSSKSSKPKATGKATLP